MDRQAAALCPPSPTGKHHWMIPGIGAEPVGHCKYCAAERKFQGCSAYAWLDYAQSRERAYKLCIEQQEVGK
ncbi:hypothetical protein LCGC14_0799730 [marine sediment metagenome]|uniref:Uncharacterized protein n=1 Tax=marine sediment metagenome TaxID=412755 RepID=A0A0F9PUJ4_9ZZZZ